MKINEKTKELLLIVTYAIVLIFALFNLINLFGVFPEKLVTTLSTAMGTTQLITATLGVILAFIIYKIEKR